MPTLSAGLGLARSASTGLSIRAGRSSPSACGAGRFAEVLPNPLPTAIASRSEVSGRERENPPFPAGLSMPEAGFEPATRGL
jgi:hypothetical protein